MILVRSAFRLAIAGRTTPAFVKRLATLHTAHCHTTIVIQEHSVRQAGTPSLKNFEVGVPKIGTPFPASH